MHGMSGKLGNLLVYRQWFGRTIVGKKPRKTTKVSDKQMVIRDKFQLASAYAKAATQDAATKDLYKSKSQPGQSAFNIALADYFTPPEIGVIDVTAYTGAVGGKIKVAVTDDVMVKTVNVAIAKADGTLIEQGAAVAEADGINWLYTATQANAAPAGCKVTVTARDMPDNVTEKDEILA